MTMQEFKKLEKLLVEMEVRLEERLVKRLVNVFEERFKQIDKRFDALEKRMDSLESRLDDLERKLEERFDIVDRQIEGLYILNSNKVSDVKNVLVNMRQVIRFEDEQR